MIRKISPLFFSYVFDKVKKKCEVKNRLAYDFVTKNYLIGLMVQLYM